MTPTNTMEELEGDAAVKPGAAHYTTPPRTVCSVHLLVQWRRHAFKVPSADRVVPALDYGTAVSIRNDPLARITGLLQVRILHSRFWRCVLLAWRESFRRFVDKLGF